MRIGQIFSTPYSTEISRFYTVSKVNALSGLWCFYATLIDTHNKNMLLFYALILTFE